MISPEQVAQLKPGQVIYMAVGCGPISGAAYVPFNPRPDAYRVVSACPEGAFIVEGTDPGQRQVLWIPLNAPSFSRKTGRVGEMYQWGWYYLKYEDAEKVTAESQDRELEAFNKRKAELEQQEQAEQDAKDLAAYRRLKKKFGDK